MFFSLMCTGEALPCGTLVRGLQMHIHSSSTLVVTTKHRQAATKGHAPLQGTFVSTIAAAHHDVAGTLCDQ